MSTRSTKSAAGFTVVELLIALAVTGVLLAAVAVALNASFKNYRENEDTFKTVNKARQALARITSQLRTAGAVDPNSPDNQCSLFTSDGDDITYSYSDVDDKLYLVDNSSGGIYTLCDNVTAMTFIKTLTENGSNVKSVQISITVVSGDIERMVSAAAVVRRNLK